MALGGLCEVGLGHTFGIPYILIFYIDYKQL